MNRPHILLFREFGFLSLSFVGGMLLATSGLLDAADSKSTSASKIVALELQLEEFTRNPARLRDAILVAEKIVRFHEQLDGYDAPETGKSLLLLARLYQQEGNFFKAKYSYQRVLQITEKQFPGMHPNTATTLADFGRLCMAEGDYIRALPLLTRALEIREAWFGPEDPATASSLSLLAALYRATGNFSQSEELYQKALGVRERILGSNHPDTGGNVSNLAGLYKDMGDYVNAEKLYRRALKISENVFGEEHENTATALNNLALVNEIMNATQTAGAYYERALAIKRKILPPGDIKIANTLSNIGLLNARINEYNKAEKAIREALTIYESKSGPEHPITATIINNLAGVYQERGDYAGAEKLSLQALSIRKKKLGPFHHDTVTNLQNLAFLSIDLGKWDEADKIIKDMSEGSDVILENILSFASEGQRLAFTADTRALSLLGTLGHARELLQAVLRRKGIVLDSLVEDRLLARASQNAKHRDMVDDLRVTKLRCTRLLMEPPRDNLSQQKSEIEEAIEQIGKLESNLTRSVNGLGTMRRSLKVTVDQVQKTLAEDQALIEFVRYQHYLGKGLWESRYGALLLTEGAEPQWQPLGEASQIEANVRSLRQAVRELVGDDVLEKSLRQVYDQVWRPIGKKLSPRIKTAIICPDGELNFLPFSTLLTEEGKFLAEKFNLLYVASGRDLVRSAAPQSQNHYIALFGNPTFQNKLTVAPLRIPQLRGERLLEQDRARRDFERITLPPLQGTEDECRALAAYAKTVGLPSQLFLNDNARESALGVLTSPYILHLATHGFFLPEEDPPGELANALLSPDDSGRDSGRRVVLKNPMLRSGLALAGAQPTLKAWAKGQVPPTEDDGIVTAEEVGELNLGSTWLVVLSACDTGNGEVRAGEGVMGLRRGFVHAGAQNLMMTLWPISDAMTVEIMKDFYATLLKGMNAPFALAKVQHRWLVDLRSGRQPSEAGTGKQRIFVPVEANEEEGFLMRAVRRAGPFMVTFQGKP